MVKWCQSDDEEWADDCPGCFVCILDGFNDKQTGCIVRAAFVCVYIYICVCVCVDVCMFCLSLAHSVTCLLSYALPHRQHESFRAEGLCFDCWCPLEQEEEEDQSKPQSESFTIWAFYIHSNTHDAFCLWSAFPFHQTIGNTGLYVCGHTEWNDERRQEKWMNE